MIFLTKQVLFKVIEDHVGLITLNRPNAANALSLQMLDELEEVIQEVNERKDIFCTIITGSSERVFCAGADLKERKGMSDAEVVKTVKKIGNVINQIAEMRVPTIAAINGAAFGGGLELALACDLRLAKEEALMGLTETALAIIPGAGGTQRLPRLIGVGKAKEMIFTAKRITGKEALEIGLVEQLVSTDNFLEEVISYAKQIIKNGPIALQQAKLAINTGIEVDLSTGLTIEHLSYKETIPTEDRIEGLTAFQEKRVPQYKGK